MNRFILGALALALSLPVAAQRYTSALGPRGGVENVNFAYADVLRVDPIYEYVNAPREECYEDRVTTRERRGDTTGGTVLGAIVGAAIGNQVGSGDGRRAATAAGAVIGGTVGHNAARDNAGPPRVYSETQHRCRRVDDYREDRRVVGYDVEYRYRGDVYVSRVGYDPGDRLRVRVSVTPAD